MKWDRDVCKYWTRQPTELFMYFQVAWTVQSRSRLSFQECATAPRKRSNSHNANSFKRHHENKNLDNWNVCIVSADLDACPLSARRNREGSQAAGRVPVHLLANTTEKQMILFVCGLILFDQQNLHISQKGMLSWSSTTQMLHKFSLFVKTVGVLNKNTKTTAHVYQLENLGWGPWSTIHKPKNTVPLNFNCLQSKPSLRSCCVVFVFFLHQSTDSISLL